MHNYLIENFTYNTILSIVHSYISLRAHSLSTNNATRLQTNHMSTAKEYKYKS